jgi:hypothetical protein
VRLDTLFVTGAWAACRHILLVLSSAANTSAPASSKGHPAFLAVLGAATDSEAAASDRWQSVAAGLLALHLVDIALAEGVVPGRARENVLRHIARLASPDPVRALLTAVVGSVAVMPRQDAPSPLVPLMAYAHALEGKAEWALAIDVYVTVTTHGAGTVAADLVPRAYQRLAYCYRVLGDLNGADRALASGRAVARASGDETAELWLRLTEANLTAHRGNLPAASAALEELLTDAARVGARQVHVAACHDCGLVAYARGQYERAALLCFAAASAYESAHQRLRALSDVATAAAALGHRALARRVNECIYNGATQPEFKWTAAVNLLEIAVEEGSETVFEHFRQSLTNEPLSASLLAHYHLFTGRGYVRFGRLLLARQAFGRALGVATDSSLNQLRVLADLEIDALGAREAQHLRTPPRRVDAAPPRRWSAAVDDLVDAVDRLQAAPVG